MAHPYLVERCVVYNTRGMPHNEVSCIYPWLRFLHTEWELNFDPVPARDWMREHPMVGIYAVVLYGVMIVGGQSYFKERKPWNWRTALALWNLSLSVFSWLGFIHTLPHLLHNIATHSVRDVVCSDPEVAYGSGANGFWVQMFALSKFPELIDTLFIIVHKKPLIFLHWYHHVTVLLYCWHSYVSSSPVGLFFVVMNYGVHAIMYGYYFLMAVKCKPKWFNAKWITFAQISQMVGGVTITFASFFYLLTDENEEQPCWVRVENTTYATLMYASYLLLFLQFFFKRYGIRGKKAKASARKKSE